MTDLNEAPSQDNIASRSVDLEALEIRLLLESVYQRFGYDFRDYAAASLVHRIHICMYNEKVQTVSALQEKVLHDPACIERFLQTLSITVTSMFRDPGMYLAFREKVVPHLRAYPSIRIWHAGCATGEEVYSMAILLQEEGLLERSRLYATDINGSSLRKANDGVLPINGMQECTANYQEAGGKRLFSEYYSVCCKNAIFHPELKANIIWAQHDLASDAVFNEFQVILCRNVMIYFNNQLSEQVHKMFYASLGLLGFLGLGNRESLRYTSFNELYQEVDADEKIYRKIK